MKMLENKRVLIVGVANKHSIAAGIAQSMYEAGAEIALTYQNERLKGNVEAIMQKGSYSKKELMSEVGNELNC